MLSGLICKKSISPRSFRLYTSLKDAVMKTYISLLSLVASCFIISFSAFADLKDIGRQNINGIYEPGYVNYQHARERSSTPNQGSNLYDIGYKNASGHYEPNYVNYPAPEKSIAVNKTDIEQLSEIGNYNQHGVYEPGYLNHKYNK